MSFRVVSAASLLLLLLLLAIGAPPAFADSFAAVRFDPQANQLVLDMSYRGTNPNHNFTLQWGECISDESGGPPGVTADVLDDQWNDAEHQSYQKTVLLDMSQLPCPRPVKLTLRTAPRFFYTLTIP